MLIQLYVNVDFLEFVMYRWQHHNLSWYHVTGPGHLMQWGHLSTSVKEQIDVSVRKSARTAHITCLHYRIRTKHSIKTNAYNIDASYAIYFATLGTLGKDCI
jgi:hypothetical protein